MKTIYVGNLPFRATEADLRELFSEFGVVHAVKIITDRETGKPRGFCFVEMDDKNALEAIAALNGADFQGRALRVNEAQEREERPRTPRPGGYENRGGSGGSGGGYGGGYGGGGNRGGDRGGDRGRGGYGGNR